VTTTLPNSRWIDLTPLQANPAAVGSVITPLVAWTDVGDRTDALFLCVINKDPTNAAHVVFDTSQDPDSNPNNKAIDQAHQYVYDIAPGQQASLEVEANNARRFWRISAMCNVGGQTSNLLWQMRVAERGVNVR
jgi:hypothetical protein